MVHGRVQGVFFRAGCAEAAATAGVAGWVSNEPDGTVQAVFEGETDAVIDMVEWCHHGPADAEVTRVDVVEEDPQGLRGFENR